MKILIGFHKNEQSPDFYSYTIFKMQTFDPYPFRAIKKTPPLVLSLDLSCGQNVFKLR
jgi:hypothetical protein